MKMRTRVSWLLVILACLVLLTVVATPAWACHRPAQADTVYKNGYIYTVDGHQSVAQAVAVRAGKIVYVGGNCGVRDFVGRNTNVVDLRGKMMMPGLADGHIHLKGFVACEMDYEGGTEDYILAKIKAALLRDDQVGMLHSNYLLNCSHFEGESMIPSGTVLTRDMLDRLSKDPSEDPMGTGTTRPILVRNADGHKYHVNSIAINNAGITADTPDPVDGMIGRYGADAPAGYSAGDPNGFFADYSPPAPWGDTVPPQSNATYLGFLDSIQTLNSLGETSIERPAGSASDCAAWQQLADDGKLTMRVNQVLTVSDWVRGETDPAVIQAGIDGINATKAQYGHYANPDSPGSLAVDTVKVFADGVAEYPAQTAAMLEPWNINIGTEDEPIWVPGIWRGEEPSVSDATLGFVMLDKAHWTIHVHAIGNRAVRETLDNFATARAANRRWDRRDVITHLQFVTPQDCKRFGPLGVVASMAMQWAERDTYTVDTLQPYVSPEVYDTMYPARSLQKGGAVLASGSDWPVDPLNPWKQIETAVRRECEPNEMLGIYSGVLNPKECISLKDSIRMHTLNVSWQMHQDKVTGSIKVGKQADLIVLDQNLFKIPVGQISDTKVLLTTVGGKVVWEDPDNPL
jgi:predicted amidohydrolase YtcJ